MSARAVQQDVHRLQVFVDEAALMDLAEGRGDADRELEELQRLHRFAEKPIERLATRILENKHRPIAIVNQSRRPNGPRAVQTVLQSVFMREPIDAGLPRALCGQT